VHHLLYFAASEIENEMQVVVWRVWSVFAKLVEA